ncbi:VOC family protein [Psychrosphaera sp. F3M07]|uniref:VOC family protein n=1 Tax=Psychrosphaera sp. F3M07 TaxID=2841560 RepID=UPI001C08BF44|nr:VOC family protein [Psychrosphaera sp. F3M07]MBU2916375.1 VOC family protein [Psychrosphaera sp. F3M07]
MSLSFHIDFNGNCQAAFEYYAQHLDANIGMLLPYKDSPASSSVPDNWQDKIVHGNIKLAGIEIAGADVRPEHYNKPKGFYLLLTLQTPEQVKQVFAHLSVNGEVLMPPQKTFWSSCYGILVDQFAVPWKINCGG